VIEVDFEGNWGGEESQRAGRVEGAIGKEDIVRAKDFFARMRREEGEDGGRGAGVRIKDLNARDTLRAQMFEEEEKERRLTELGAARDRNVKFTVQTHGAGVQV